MDMNNVMQSGRSKIDFVNISKTMEGISRSLVDVAIPWGVKFGGLKESLFENQAHYCKLTPLLALK